MRVPKAKTGKIGPQLSHTFLSSPVDPHLVRIIVDEIARVPGSAAVVVEICKGVIEWAEKEERTFLRLNLQTKLAQSLYETQKVLFSSDFSPDYSPF